MTRWNNHVKTIVLLGALSALLIGLSTHPATAERIARLEALAGGARLRS
jgi:hypothetical protein